MNKLVKLPLFLGAVGCLCGGVLALVNHFTEPVIKENEEKKANAAFYEHFSNFDKKNTVAVSDTLAASGVTQKYYAFDASKTYIGTIYECSVVGYAGKSSPIKFTISFANGQPNHYVALSHAESNVGKIFMDWLAGDVDGNRLSNLEAGKTFSGSTVTYAAVNSAVTVCSADYLAELVNTPTYVEGAE
ncbi:MAG: hypothetical protein ACI311_00230 [Bacilli bacterium]